MTTERTRLLSEAHRPYLTDRERQALSHFLERLEATAGDRVQHVIFFGSKARGDAESYADLDLMVVADIEQDELDFDARILSDYKRPDREPKFTEDQLQPFPAEAQRLVTRIERFLQERGFAPSQDD